MMYSVTSGAYDVGPLTISEVTKACRCLVATTGIFG